MSVLQSIGDAVQNGLAPTVVGMVNLAAIAAVSIQNWRGRVASIKELADTKVELVGQLSALDSTVKGHIENSPTLTSCQVHTQSLERYVRKEYRNTVNQVQVLVTDQDRKLEKLDDEVEALKVRDAIRTDRNGVES